MKFEGTLISGELIKRYKRFFVDIKVNNKILTSHCPNTGSMMGLIDTNNKVWISKSDNLRRKLKYTLEMINVKKSLVGVNTHRANKIVKDALENNKIKELLNCDKILPETVYDKNTRFDFLLIKGKRKIFLEVKNVTLSINKNIAEFPDAITVRGNKHLHKLMEAKKKGFESYILYLIQRENIKKFKISSQIDPEYYSSFMEAKKKGINILAYTCDLNSKEIKIKERVDVL